MVIVSPILSSFLLHWLLSTNQPLNYHLPSKSPVSFSHFMSVFTFFTEAPVLLNASISSLANFSSILFPLRAREWFTIHLIAKVCRRPGLTHLNLVVGTTNSAGFNFQDRHNIFQSLLKTSKGSLPVLSFIISKAP